MPNIELLVILSICCDIVLFALIAWLFFMVRRLGHRQVETLINQLKESNQLVERLEAVIQEKARLSKNIQASFEQASRQDHGAGIEHEKVVLLHQKGLDADKISEVTGLTKGEIDLILSIRSVTP